MKLSEYQNDTTALLRDGGYYFNSQFQVTRWINEARRLLAMRTGCILRLVTGQSAFGATSQPGYAIPGATQPDALPQAFPYGANMAAGAGSAAYGASATPVAGSTALSPMMTIPGVERYPYVTFFNSYLKQQHAGCDRVNDVISLSVSWGGVSKPALDWMPWDEFQAYCRAYNIFNMAYPAVWTVLNDGTFGEVFMFPIPTQANPIDASVSCLPSSLNSDNDFDAIPDTFADSVKFGAAALAFMSTYRWASADTMIAQGGGYVLPQRASADRGKTRSYYPSFP